MDASFFQSEKWKTLMGKLYGFGAALVIIGALFKLQHWSGAGYMLSIGMLTEFVIFIFSAFDPPAKDYHWENVHPELLSGEPPVKNQAAQQGRAAVPAINGLDIDAAMAEEIKKNMAKFNDTVKSLNSLSDIAEASNNFVGGVQKATGSVDTLNLSINALNDVYRDSTKTLQASGKQTGENLDMLNKHMAAVNASYELYIQEHKKHIAAGEQLIDTMKQSADRSLQFAGQMDKLNSRIDELNNIYGSMISTVNTALKK